MITAHARESEADNSAFVSAYCTVTGSGGTTILGRAWRPYSRVIFAYTEMSNVITPQGWSNNLHPEFDKTLYYGEFKNTDPGPDPAKRAPFTKQLAEADAQKFLSLGFIEGSNWLLPPHSV
ncbi:hypothetical protein F0562_031436 [Nyssa sinensis]|uniref:pectinesterase n=1 Tax=Nyssa sinensis TaxID=561372 RepID=A0A5J5AU56_9ASTE|nr:hypothetical protein F0562_031436 [Nyssa sinensis]